MCSDESMCSKEPIRDFKLPEVFFSNVRRLGTSWLLGRFAPITLRCAKMRLGANVIAGLRLAFFRRTHCLIPAPSNWFPLL